MGHLHMYVKYIGRKKFIAERARDPFLGLRYRVTSLFNRFQRGHCSLRDGHRSLKWSKSVCGHAVHVVASWDQVTQERL